MSDPFADKQTERDLKKAGKCQFCPAVEELSVTRRQQLHDAMFGKTLVGGKRIKVPVIVGVLEGWGISVLQSVISKHVTGTNLSEPCKRRVQSKWGATS